MGNGTSISAVWYHARNMTQSTVNDRLGEGFRMPSGVGKPPKHEPAALRSWSMGISCFARLEELRSRPGSAIGGGSVRQIRRLADGGLGTCCGWETAAFP